MPTSSLSAVVPLPSSLADAAMRPLAGEAPLTRVVRHLVAAVDDPADLVVAADERLVADVRAVLADVGPVDVVAVEQPATRLRCLVSGLEHIVRERDSTQQVLVHDVRQPLVSDGVRDRVAARLAGGDRVVLPVVPVTDSIKAVDQQGSVTATLDRTTLRAVQFPRGFAVDHLAALLDGAGEGSDEVQAAIRAGMPITTVDGDTEAFVADLPRDAQFAEAVIATRPR